MSPRIAIELTPTHLRAVVAGAWRDQPRRTLDVPWSPDAPEGGIAVLREGVGAIDSIAVSVGLGLLHLAHVDLPPAPHAARERMLALESERFFATDAPVTAAIAPGGLVAMAVDAAALERWCVALERWAPIMRIEPAPAALARILARIKGGASPDGYRVAAGDDEHGFVAVRDGRVTAVRRIPQAIGERPGAPLPIVHGVPATHLAAWGSLLGEESDDEGTLASPARRRALAARRRRRLGVAWLAAAAGLVLLLASADRWRERTVHALADDVASRRAAAEPGEAALALRARLDAELAYLAKAAEAKRGGTLGALAAISAAMPHDAVILNARAVGRDWQVDGTAASAAALVPHLDRDGHFEDVRILSASARFRDGPRTRETFSIALRVRPGA